MTKNKAKRLIRELLEKAANFREEVESLQAEAEEAYNEIEPYDGNDDLTPAQEERQEWYSDLEDKLSEAVDAIETIESDLEEMAY